MDGIINFHIHVAREDSSQYNRSLSRGTRDEFSFFSFHERERIPTPFLLLSGAIVPTPYLSVLSPLTIELR